MDLIAFQAAFQQQFVNRMSGPAQIILEQTLELRAQDNFSQP